MDSWFPNLFLWAKANWKRLTSVLIALVLIFFSPLLINYFGRFLSWHDINYKRDVLSTLSSVIGNTVFALFAYTLFRGQIDRWLGHDVTEAVRFDPKSFLRNIRKANQKVIIQETYIRVLIRDYKEDFEKGVYSFYKNCIAKGTTLEGCVLILVLHPFSQAVAERYNELKAHISESTLTEFLQSTQTLLIEIKKIQDDINQKVEFDKRGGKRDFFEIKISYEKPNFSLYYCDQYASISYYENIPCEDAPQLVFRNKGKIIAAEKHKELFEQNWEKAILLPKNYFEHGHKDEAEINEIINVVESFKKMTASTDEKEIINCLLNISKMCRPNFWYALELIYYVESNHKKKSINYLDIKNQIHFNNLGSGGDRKDRRTINISTIASILASHYSDIDVKSISVIKCGTLAVTGKVGSQTFYQNLQSKIYNDSEEYRQVSASKRKFLNYNLNNGSAFLPITYFGYMYRDILRGARKKFSDSHPDCIDIYKIVFPLVNLTGYTAAINGVSSDQYFSTFQDIYQTKQKTGIILKNTNSVDELFWGTNTIVYYKNGDKLWTTTLRIKIADPARYKDFFNESDSPDQGHEHVEKFFQLFNVENENITKEIRETVAYNVALFIQLHFLVNNDYPPTENRAEADFGFDRLKGLMKDVYEFFFSNTIVQ